jgi:hypothetical protein
MGELTMKRMLFASAVIGLLAFNTFSASFTRALRFDVAVDQASMAGVGLPQMGPPQRGNTFIINGKIFPAGTLLPGPQQNDPNAAGSIGDFYCRATVANNLPAGPGLPDLINTQLFRFNSQNQITTEGIESGEPGLAWMRVITGGTGIYLGASGSVRIETIGTNASGGFNQRVVFKMIERNND